METDQAGLTRYLEGLRAAALRLAGSPDEADDLVQDCLASAVQEGERGRTPCVLGAWLHQILRRRWYDRIRRRSVERRYRSGYRPEVPDAAPDVELVHRALQALDPDTRRLLERRFFDGRTSVDLGREMGKSDGAVRSLLFHALRRFEAAVQKISAKENA